MSSFFWEGRSLSRVSVFGRSFQIQVATTTCIGIIFLCCSLLLKLVHIGSIQTVQQPSLNHMRLLKNGGLLKLSETKRSVVHKIAQDSEILFVTAACLQRPCLDDPWIAAKMHKTRVPLSTGTGPGQVWHLFLFLPFCHAITTKRSRENHTNLNLQRRAT